MAPDEKDRHWFWDYTSRWWFIPAYYLFFCLICIAIAIIPGLKAGTSLSISPKELLTSFMAVFIYLPAAPIYLAMFLIPNAYPNNYEPIVFVPHLILICGYTTLTYFRYKKKIILKWLIIALLALILISFTSCEIIANTALSKNIL